MLHHHIRTLANLIGVGMVALVVLVAALRMA
jgi:hypothetical protein